MVMTQENIEVKEQKVIDGVIYKVTNLANEKVYIGLTILGLEKRKKAHYSQARNPASRNTYFYRALNKYSEECFIWEIIDTATTKEELNAKEIYWIAFYNSYGNGGYNLTYGGEGNLGYIKPEWKNKKGKKLKKRIKMSDRVGELSNSAKLTEKDVLEIRDLIIEGEPIEDIAKIYRVSGGAIRGIKGGYNWSHFLTKEDIEKMNDSYRQIKINRVLKIRDLLIEGLKTTEEIAAVVDVGANYVTRIRKGEAWRDVLSDEDVSLMSKNFARVNTELRTKIVSVKDLLIEGELTQMEIVEETGVNATAVSQIKNGVLWSDLFSDEDNEKLEKRRSLKPHESKVYIEERRVLKEKPITLAMIQKRAKKIEREQARIEKEFIRIEKEKEIKKIIEMLLENKSVKEISKQLNAKINLVYKIRAENIKNGTIKEKEKEKTRDSPKLNTNKSTISKKEAEKLKREEKIFKTIKTKDYLIEGIKTIKEIAKEVNVKESFVYSILSGKNRRDIITEEDVIKMQSKTIKRSGLKKEKIIKIKDVLLEDRYTVKEISELLGISKSVVDNIKAGRQRGEMFTREERQRLKEIHERIN